jgi:hypothetical protein
MNYLTTLSIGISSFLFSCFQLFARTCVSVLFGATTATTGSTDFIIAELGGLVWCGFSVGFIDGWGAGYCIGVILMFVIAFIYAVIFCLLTP